MNMTVDTSIVNVGRIDALLRASLALALIWIVLSMDFGPVMNFVLTMLSIPTMLFAMLRWDPIYSLFGLRTGKYTLRA